MHATRLLATREERKRTAIEAAAPISSAVLYQLIADQRLRAAKNDRGRIVVDLAEAREGPGLANEPE